MNTSTRSASSKALTERERLAKVFWQNRLIDAFRQDRGSMFRVDIRRPLKFMEWVMGDEIMGPTPEADQFTFEAIYVCGVRFMIVVSGDSLVVPPFEFPEGALRAAIPYFPEEVAACSRSR